MLGVALLDDHPAVLAGLRRLIDPEPGLDVLAAAPSAPQLARMLRGRRPDVLVLDYDLARGDGLSHCRRVKGRANPPAVVVYSAYAGPALALAARAAQADALVDKAEPASELLAAIRAVARGEQIFPGVSHEVHETAVARLDDADLPVLAMLLDGEPVDAIAHALRTDRDAIARRAQRIVGRLSPHARERPALLSPRDP